MLGSGYLGRYPYYNKFSFIISKCVFCLSIYRICHNTLLIKMPAFRCQLIKYKTQLYCVKLISLRFYAN